MVFPSRGVPKDHSHSPGRKEFKSQPSIPRSPEDTEGTAAKKAPRVLHRAIPLGPVLIPY